MPGDPVRPHGPSRNPGRADLFSRPRPTGQTDLPGHAAAAFWERAARALLCAQLSLIWYWPLSSAVGKELRMRATRLFPTIFVLSVLLSAHAVGETLGDARVGFSAERLLVVDGRSYVGRMWHMPGEQRHEQQLPAINPVFILRAGSALADVVLPQLHAVVELALPKEFALLGREIARHLRELGTNTRGPAPLTKKDRSRFLAALDAVGRALLCAQLA